MSVSTPSTKRLRIGLTGGIGSGKTTVADLFAEKGVAVWDADQVARDLLEPGEMALAAIVARHGTCILCDGRLNRPVLKRLIFAHPEERVWLDELMHPLVYQRLDDLMQTHPDTPYHLVVVPLLLESGRRDFVDALWVVDCPEAVQRERVARRDGLDSALIDRIMASQSSRRERLAQADAVIDNATTPAHLRTQVDHLHHSLLASLSYLHVRS